MFFFSKIFTGRPKRGYLVSWVEKASLERIRRFIEIIKGECNHELLLSMKNLRELCASPFPYIVTVIPHPLPTNLVRGKHYTLSDLLKSIPRSYVQEGCTQEPQVEIAQETTATFTQLYQSPLDKQDSRPTPQVAMKKKKNKKGKIIATRVGLKGFIDWVDPNASDPADMFSLVVGFSAQMPKHVASAKGETTLSSEVSRRKHPNWSGPIEEARRGGR